jgi:hypothetical protein
MAFVMAGNLVVEMELRLENTLVGYLAHRLVEYWAQKWAEKKVDRTAVLKDYKMVERKASRWVKMMVGL